jgi:formylglycine-generating enzyme required for sulfatase activity
MDLDCLLKQSGSMLHVVAFKVPHFLGEGPYAKNDRGCFLANFKPLRGNYAADQALYTVEADAYEPNDYNLFNMAGNVSEWINSSYDQTSYQYSASFNPKREQKRRSKKGHSRWVLERCRLFYTG